MKKAIVLLVVTAITALTLCSCKYAKCDICGKKGFVDERSVFGIDVYVCSDCG